MNYEAVIGLEVHAQLKTRSKLFCSCSTAFGQEPNTNTCPVCAGMPGMLPVINKKAVEYATKMALAVGCQINKTSVFARKNYFYPDLPKGYQISQYELPLAEKGSVEIELQGKKKVIGITRIHMEDDAGKLVHSPAENVSFVDLNRTGTPLIEIVSEPDMHSPVEAVAYLKALRAILVYLGICEANMEEGNFRCDANVSLRPLGSHELGTRTELKNMNSFRHVQRALEIEIGRQQALLEDGEEVLQETRLYDQDSGQTRTMRSKEEAHDYRYFPDPDLVPLTIASEDIVQWQKELPELPQARQARFVEEHQLGIEEAQILTADPGLANYFESVVREFPRPKEVANWILSEVLRELKEIEGGISSCQFAPKQFAVLLKMIAEDKISMKIGKQIFPELFKDGLDPEQYVQQKGLLQISDQGALEEAVQEVLTENPKEVEAYKQGKKKLRSFFMGQVMKKTRGKANPKLVNQFLTRYLES